MLERKTGFRSKSIVDGAQRFNQISMPADILFNILFLIIALVCIIPLVFVVIISLSSNDSIRTIGYSFTPNEWSLSAYSYLWRMRAYIGRALFVSVGITVIGTILGLLLNSTMAYVLSRKSFRLRRFFTLMIFIPMLFHGGLVSTYLINTKLLHLGNTYLALILPLVKVTVSAVSSMVTLTSRSSARAKAGPEAFPPLK